MKTEAQAAWVAARARSDFPAFQPYLERSFALQRRIADALGWAEHPYDALVAQYEPGMTLAKLNQLFATLRARLRPLLARVQDQPPPRRDFLDLDYPVYRQKAFDRSLTELVCFDHGRGRLDEAVHPFEISFTRDDVRITARYRPNFLPAGLFAALHEAGHGLYEQGIDPELTRSALATDLVNLYAVGGASFGMHESQSRLLENRVGRSRRFWELHFGRLRDAFPDQLADVSATEFWRAVNLVRPGLIRVEADELTYDLHIMLRVELEAAIVAGDLAVADLPAAWAERMRDDLGLTVPDDAPRRAAGHPLVDRLCRLLPDLHAGQRHGLAAVRGGGAGCGCDRRAGGRRLRAPSELAEPRGALPRPLPPAGGDPAGRHRSRPRPRAVPTPISKASIRWPTPDRASFRSHRPAGGVDVP